MEKKESLTVIVPAYNEEDSIRLTVRCLVASFNKTNFDWQLVLVDDGSTDKTGEIIGHLALIYPNIKIVKHKLNMGLGRSFCDGVKNSDKENVTWIPADGENDLDGIIKYFFLLEYVDVIVPFVTNTNIRPWKRRFLSKLYLLIVNFSFGTFFNYTNGNIVYKREIFDVIKPRANSFFIHTECLIKAVRAGFLFAEVPVYLKKRKKGRSKALTVKSFYSLVREYIKLFCNLQ